MDVEEELDRALDIVNQEPEPEKYFNPDHEFLEGSNSVLKDYYRKKGIELDIRDSFEEKENWEHDLSLRNETRRLKVLGDNEGFIITIRKQDYIGRRKCPICNRELTRIRNDWRIIEKNLVVSPGCLEKIA